MVLDLFFILMLSIPHVLFSTWIQSANCSRSYSEEILDYGDLFGDVNGFPNYSRCIDYDTKRKGLCQFNVSTIHACSARELAPFGVSPPKPLIWAPLQGKDNILKSLWLRIYDLMAGLSLTFIGDSLQRQLEIAIIVYFFETLHITCELDQVANTVVCPNGLRITRPFQPYPHIDALTNAISRNNISIVNYGLHYIDYQNDRKPYLDHVEDALAVMDNMVFVNKTKIAWIDTFSPHFSSVTGDVHEDHEGYCGPLNENRKNASSSFSISPKLFHTKYKHIYHIHTQDMTFDRYDMHLGYLTHFEPEHYHKLDCVHVCMQPCYWDAILLRVGEVLQKMLK